jgi:hypothetical protein
MLLSPLVSEETSPSTARDPQAGSLGSSLLPFLFFWIVMSKRLADPSHPYFSFLNQLSIDIDSFNGSTIPERAAQAAASINADFLSPVATSYASNVTDVNLPGFIPFTTKPMVDMAHELGLAVKPWTPNRFVFLLPFAPIREALS